MSVTKTITEFWGGEEAIITGFGPIHYFTCRFAEDDEKFASIGCKPENVNRVRESLQALVGVAAEYTLELNDKGNFRIKDYAGKHGSELRVVGVGGSMASSSRPAPTPTPTVQYQGPDPDVMATIMELLAEIDRKLGKLLDQDDIEKSALEIVKDVLGAEELEPGEASVSVPDTIEET